MSTGAGAGGGMGSSSGPKHAISTGISISSSIKFSKKYLHLQSGTRIYNHVKYLIFSPLFTSTFLFDLGNPVNSGERGKESSLCWLLEC